MRTPPNDVEPLDGLDAADRVGDRRNADRMRGIGRVLAGLGHRRTGRPLLFAAAALAGVGLLAAAALGGWWASVALSDTTRTATARDAALRAGEQAVQNFNTLDYRSAQAGLNLWLESSTGSLHDQINAGQAQFKTEIEQAKTVTAAKVLDGSLTELNTSQCKASLIVALQVTITPSTGTAQTKQVRIQGALTGTPAQGTCSGWKLSSIQQVPVGTGSATSGPATSGAPSTTPTTTPSTAASGH